MSRGPGRIERAIRELLDAHPDLAFVTDDLVTHCYPGITTIERKHQVSVLRAMHKVIANDPDWWEWKIECGQGSGAVFLNYGSLKSYTMGREMCWRYVSPKWGARKQHRRYTIGPSRFPWVDESSKPTDRAEFNASLKIEIGGLHDLEVQYHCANRDGFTVLADSLLNRIDALRGRPLSVTVRTRATAWQHLTP